MDCSVRWGYRSWPCTRPRGPRSSFRPSPRSPVNDPPTARVGPPPLRFSAPSTRSTRGVHFPANPSRRTHARRSDVDLVAGVQARSGPPSPFFTASTVCSSSCPVTCFSHSRPWGSCSLSPPAPPSGPVRRPDLPASPFAPFRRLVPSAFRLPAPWSEDRSAILRPPSVPLRRPDLPGPAVRNRPKTAPSCAAAPPVQASRPFRSSRGGWVSVPQAPGWSVRRSAFARRRPDPAPHTEVSGPVPASRPSVRLGIVRPTA